jgi:predicted O-linked N-acetylglucosamine transferase (SPINDLY family)
MRILRRVDGSSLFLYAGNPIAERNLRRAAAHHEIDPRRIVFGARLALADYLARLRTMDLFLDTLPYNAGTTASDALWAGLPVLTCEGRSFAGRVGASLLRAIELPELITSTSDEYVDLAVRLAANPAELDRIRRTLAHNRCAAPLFDTARFTRSLESTYTQIYDRNRANLLPEHVYARSLGTC